MLPGLRGAEITGIRLPRIGELADQLLVDVTLANKTSLVVPSPVSGVVVVVNELLSNAPDGWQAIRSERAGSHVSAPLLDEEMGGVANRGGFPVKCRSLLLRRTRPRNSRNLVREVRQAADRTVDRTAWLAESEGHAASLDAASLGDAGPGSSAYDS